MLVGNDQLTLREYSEFLVRGGGGTFAGGGTCHLFLTRFARGGIGGYEYFAKVPRGGGHPFLQQ